MITTILKYLQFNHYVMSKDLKNQKIYIKIYIWAPKMVRIFSEHMSNRF